MADPHRRPSFDQLYNKFCVKLEKMEEFDDDYLTAEEEDYLTPINATRRELSEISDTNKIEVKKVEEIPCDNCH
jgi:hypothetical protein